MTLQELPFLAEEHSTTLLPLQTNEVWPIVNAHIRAAVGAEAFKQWFAGVKVEGIFGDTVELSVPTYFLKTWIHSHYYEKVLRAWQKELSHVRQIRIVNRGSVLLCTERTMKRSPESEASRHVAATHRAETALKKKNTCSYPCEFGPYLLPLKLPTHTLVRLILCVVAGQFEGVRVEDIQGSNRCAKWVRARHLAMYLIHVCTPLSLPQIGTKWFDGRDHTTILHGVRKIGWLIGEREGAVPYSVWSDPLRIPIDEELVEMVNRLKGLCKQYL